ncbi:hypothetical protein PI124_g7562 [Phytophthora idaei]|nr:hypothetical protein PI125_g20632 [Phytophthora idaei]KAG3147130.1 hypothetical protein PI126_g12990 [Phytophthora idaei]KAG3247748.1 hypothetical protein PI124_g7562 [Phytophthora idaei]
MGDAGIYRHTDAASIDQFGATVAQELATPTEHAEATPVQLICVPVDPQQPSAVKPSSLPQERPRESTQRPVKTDGGYTVVRNVTRKRAPPPGASTPGSKHSNLDGKTANNLVEGPRRPKLDNTLQQERCQDPQIGEDAAETQLTPELCSYGRFQALMDDDANSETDDPLQVED